MISHPPILHKPFSLIVFWGLASAAWAGAEPRLGPFPLDAPKIRQILDEARVYEHSRAGRMPPRAALKRRPLLQGVLRRALELELAEGALLSLEAGLEPHEEAEILARALEHEGIMDLDALIAAVEARFEAPFPIARRALLSAHVLNRAREALVERIPLEVIRAAYLREEARARLDIVEVNRVPSGPEIDAFIRAESPALRAYYAAHPRLFSSPARVVIKRLTFEDEALARARYARAEAGQDLEALAGQEGRVDRRVRSEAQAPARYAQPDGTLSALIEEGGRFSFEKVIAHLPGHQRRLSDPRVQREIAAALLRERDTLPRARALIQGAREALIAGREVDLEARPGLLRVTQSRPFPPGSVVPGIGLAPKLNEAAFSLPIGGVTPILVIRQHYVVARVRDRVTPDEASWRAEGEAFAARWRAKAKRRILDELSEQVGSEIALEGLWGEIEAWIGEDQRGGK